MSAVLHGILAPVVTTFDAGGESIAPSRFHTNLRAHLASGASGIVVAGSTGEAALLDDAERAELLEIAREIVPTDCALLMGVGSESTRATVARARDAAARGADMVLVVPPHYYGRAMTRAALLAHFRAVADASERPVVLYNIPVYAHFTLEPELVAELAAHDNIVGMKDSAGDLAALRSYLEVQSSRFTVLTGHGQTFQDALALGARGGILAVSLFAPEPAHAVYDAVKSGNAQRATDAQTVLGPLARDIVGAWGPAGIKAALDLVGLHGGPVRAPLQPLDDTTRLRVAALLQAGAIVAA